MAIIFISYKRVDKDKVFKIKDQVESATGEKCWIDLDGVESDAQFANVIIKAINECEVFLFMYSAAHSQITDYKNDWTVRELDFAQHKKKRIVFVNLDASPLSDWFYILFGTMQQVDATNPESLAKLIRDIKCWISKPNPAIASESSCSNQFNLDEYHDIKIGRPVRLYKRQIRKIKHSKLFSAISLVVILIVGGISLPQFILRSHSRPFKLSVNGENLIMIPIKGNDTINRYYISQSEITQSLWSAVMGDNPSECKGDSLPVANVSWYDCIRFCSKLSELTGLEFNLPTKDQWLFAATACDTLKYSGSDTLKVVAWNNSLFVQPHSVATKKPNSYGLYDMSGNVKEWCLDSLPQSSLMRLIMGGSSRSTLQESAIGHLDYDYVVKYGEHSHCDIGLRIVMNNKKKINADSLHIKALRRILAVRETDERRYKALPRGEINGHSWVDLGLPSGTKWATENMSSHYSIDTGYGDFYAWGEIKDCNDRFLSITDSTWPTYQFYVSGGSQYDDPPKFSKYVLDKKNGKVDGLYELELSDDAAHVIWGKGWRIPTKVQTDELENLCTWIWSTGGYKVIGPNGNSIFLPAAGYICGGWHDKRYGEEGYYWSRTLYTEGDGIGEGAHWISFNQLDHENGNKFKLWAYRYFACRIRPVIDAE